MSILKCVLRRILGFFKAESGTTAMEYAFCLSLITTAILASVDFVGQSVSQQFQTTSGALGAGGSGGASGGNTGGDSGGKEADKDGGDTGGEDGDKDSGKKKQKKDKKSKK